MNIKFLKSIPSSSNKNLVIVRAGTQSLHPKYFYDSHDLATWDRMVLTYSEPSELDLNNSEFVVKGGLSKWTDLTCLLDIDFFNAMGYDYVMLADEDVIPSNSNTINILFQLAKKYGFEICQPALTHNSYFAWLITLHSPAFHVRFTNFVECMVPVFSLNSLKIMREELSMAVSGYGLDVVFSELFDLTKNPLGIIDDATFCHTKPIDPNGGSFYLYLKDNGVDPLLELNQFMSRFKLSRKDFITLGGVSKSEPIFSHKF